MTRWFTSDLHLHHAFVAALRGFVPDDWPHDETIREVARERGVDLHTIADMETHDHTIIDEINKRVHVQDELYVLGDISSGSTGSLRSALDSLRRLDVPRKRRHLILGNHENLRADHGQGTILLDVFGEVSTTGSIVLDGENVLLSHFQFARHFDGQARAGMSGNMSDPKYRRYAVADDGHTLLLHGHTHARTAFEFGCPRELNIGVDAWGLRPVSEDEIITLMHDGRFALNGPSTETA